MNGLNPVGEYPDSAVCETLGHDWKMYFVFDLEFISCQRCQRNERKNWQNNVWEVNKIYPSVA